MSVNGWGDNPLGDYFNQLNGLPPVDSGVTDPFVPTGSGGIPPTGGGGGGKFASAVKGIMGSIMSKEALQALFMWQVLGQLIGGALAPVTSGITRLADDVAPLTPISPADLADATVRGFREHDKSRAMARQSGIDGPDFDTMVQLAGAAPAPDALAEALRRGLIPEDSGDPNKPGFVQGIMQGRLADKWTDMVKGLSMQLPSPADVLDAYLQGQTDEATAQKLYKEFGGDPKYFTLMYDTRGSAPTPLEASQMANRGIIPWDGTGAGKVSYEQAFLEGPWRNKWSEPYRKLAEYIPPPTHIATLLKDGAINEQQAVDYLKQNGMTQPVAEAYLKSAMGEKTAGTKQLAEGTITKLYQDRMITKGQAAQMLATVGYSKTDADYILGIVDVVRAEAALNKAVSKISSLYVGHKLDKTAAINALNALHVPGDEVSQLINTWDLEVQANVRTLTEAQIVDAWHLEIIDTETAMAELEWIGYQPLDAWILLSIKNKGPLDTKPTQPA